MHFDSCLWKKYTNNHLFAISQTLNSWHSVAKWKHFKALSNAGDIKDWLRINLYSRFLKFLFWNIYVTKLNLKTEFQTQSKIS